MKIIPGLTSTRKERIAAWIRDLRRSSTREIALFPTVLTSDERAGLYDELGGISGLTIPHVHLRTDCDEREMKMLADRFGTSLFNIHPEGTKHEFGAVPALFAQQVFVENVDSPPSDEELGRLGGLCADYAHLEAARALGWDAYVDRVEHQLLHFRVGCCHVSAVRPDDPNPWHGGPDHHEFLQLDDLDYLRAYRDRLPKDWISLELENPLSDQLEAVEYLTTQLAPSPG